MQHRSGFAALAAAAWCLAAAAQASTTLVFDVTPTNCPGPCPGSFQQTWTVGIDSETFGSNYFSGVGAATSTTSPIHAALLDVSDFSDAQLSSRVGLTSIYTSGFPFGTVDIWNFEVAQSGLIQFAPTGLTDPNTGSPLFRTQRLMESISFTGSPHFGSGPYDLARFVAAISNQTLTYSATASNTLAPSLFGGRGTTQEESISFSGTAVLNLVASGLAPAPGGVPEPSSWALLIAGFGMAGVAIRRRRQAVA